MNQRRQMIGVAGAAVAVTVLFFVFALKPKLDQISQTREQIIHAQAEGQQLRADIARLEALRGDAPELNARLARVSSLLPSTPDLPNFIRLLQTAATESGIDLQSIAPSPPAKLANGTGIDQISVSLTVMGNFHRMEDFLARLEQLRRIVLVNAISLTPQEDELSGGITLQGTLTLQMFVVQPDARLTGGTATGPAAPAEGTSS